jgi:ZIP family zinc transporter
VLEAAFWGFVGGVALLLGAAVGLRWHASQKVIGLVMAFGSGVLISALAFELTAESFDRGGGDTVALGLAAGGLCFFAGDWLLDRRGGAAVFLSNIPESLSAATGLRKAGHSPRWILGLWLAVALVSALAAGLGYAALGDASPSVVGFFQAFAAGAILTMLADTMMPEAFEHGGQVAGLVTLLGFALAFLLSATS